MSSSNLQDALEGVAIIGMSGRFPGAGNIDEFWKNLKEGVESISYFSKEDAKACGVSDDALNDPDYVCAGGILEDVEMFDAGFFGFTPREAENMDPQQRLFLECSYEALENAGYAGNKFEYPVGVYAGSNMSTYFMYHLLDKVGVKDDFSMVISNDKDYMATRVSYEFNLKGPSISVQTACSTSATAIAMACEGLLNYHCDMALAGGAAVKLPQKMGYLYEAGMIASPDGHTRPFDAGAQGTIFSSAVGVVVLKRLEDAINDGDNIYAVIKGIAINNDGSDKVGFVAPSREGQAEVIAAAQNLAGINPEDISYIETHGTGTSLGDPIEVSALAQVFGQSTKKKAFCAIGSVKSNIGHAVSAAGVTGMIKTALSLKHGQIPPSINFESSNPKIDFDNSPFYVNTKLSNWTCSGKPRLAGVSSFGFGGTNVHAVLEEAPSIEASDEGAPWQLLTLSARSSEALDRMASNLAKYFSENPCVNLADAAYTLHAGRKEFEYRRAVVCRNNKEASELLILSENENIFSGTSKSTGESINFEFPINSSELEDKLKELAKLWTEGSKIDWNEFHKDEKRLKIPLPTYPFERKRHWVEQFDIKGLLKQSRQTSVETPGKSHDYNDWLYYPTWKRAMAIPFRRCSLKKEGSWLLFMDETGFGEKIVGQLTAQGIRIITAVKADRFLKLGDDTYAINPEQKEDYRTLLKELGKEDIKTILHLWSVTPDYTAGSRLEFSRRCQTEGFYSLLFLAQTIGEMEFKNNIRLAVVSNNMHSVSGERVLHPEKIPVLGPVRVIPREYEKVSCQSIDIVLPDNCSTEEDRLAKLVLAEVTEKVPEFIVALRGYQRFVQVFEKINLNSDEKCDWIKDGGTYLITGGLGGLGLAAAEHMTKKSRINLVLTRRSFFPERDKWQEWLEGHNEDDKISKTIRQLMLLEKLGSRIITANADITRRDQMEEVLLKAQKSFGEINGVIHAAGIADNGLIQDKTVETAAKVLDPKVTGTLVLDELFKDKELDFLVLFSSSSTILGNAGFVDYCGANSFLDAYAWERNSKTETFTVAVNWDEWDEIGMGADGEAKSRVRSKITVNEGLKLLDNILSSKSAAQVVVSPGDFLKMLKDIGDYLHASIEGRQVGSEEPERVHNRPDIGTQYVEPGNKTEEAIVKIWEELLGVYPVGINDDFFDLGGHSLLATSMISKLAKRFRKTFSMQSLFENSTVSKLAVLVEAEQEDEENFEEGAL